MKTKIKCKLSATQKSIIYGTLLGDGWLETSTQGRTWRFGFKQKKAQKDYVCHVYKILSNLCSSSPIENSDDVQFKTKTLACFRFYNHQFYDKNHKKKVPKFIHRWLKPEVLAYWFMDDGYKDKKHGALLCTDSFEKKDVERLIQAIQQNFQLNCWLRKNKQNWRIYISSSSSQRFRNFIEPYVVPSMLYKLPDSQIMDRES